MASPRPSRLGSAGAFLGALIAVLGAAVQDVADRMRSDSNDLDRSEDRSRSGGRAIPLPAKPPERCPPYRGRLVTRRWNMSQTSRDYQVRVTGFPPYTEWEFETIEFDGFREAECRLQEAKAQYDQFFDPNTKRPKPFFVLVGLPRMLDQARRQYDVVQRNPPAKLTWYFMQPVAHEYFAQRFLKFGLPIECLLHP